jgi:hypothetical protein
MRLLFLVRWIENLTINLIPPEHQGKTGALFMTAAMAVFSKISL